MYRHCIFCSGELGRNEAIEPFPVGRTLAYDAWKGRLWAVCPRCRRWNLAPMEERWEAVEAAERLFRDARLRVHSENIGVAQLSDRTRLIRVGEALPGELAAWRYGDQVVRRRWRAWFGAGAAATGVVLVAGGAPLMAAAGVPAMAAGWGLQIAGQLMLVRNERRPVLRLSAEGGTELVIRVQHARFARVLPAPQGVAVALPSPLPARREVQGGVVRWVSPPDLRLEGAESRRFLERALVSANSWGVSSRKVRDAVDRLGAAGGAAAFLDRAGAEQAGRGLFGGWGSNNPHVGFDPKGAWRRFVGTFRGERIPGRALPVPPRSVPRVEALALEMALHEEAERAAMQGELAALEAAWREAEEIAAIADTLPDDPLLALRAGREGGARGGGAGNHSG